jgi:hypothetical protein
VKGGTDGNEQLTALTGAVLIVLLAVVGVTILRIGQLISVHLFVGLLLLGPVALKLASTGYRFARYYVRTGSYRRKGPPPALLRVVAPVVVSSTLVVFASGVILLFEGPARRSLWLLVHKVSFFVWVAFTALHVLGHVPGLGATLRAGTRRSSDLGTPGSAERWIALGGALATGLVLAVVLIPDFASWTGAGAFVHHHRH